MGKLAGCYARYLSMLAERLSQEGMRGVTPVDLTYKGLSVGELRELNRGGDIEDIYGLSPLQEGLYYHWLREPESAVYFEQMRYELTGELDMGLVERSYGELVERHGILRTHFTQEAGDRVLQVMRRGVAGGFGYGEVQEESAAEELRRADRSRSFDLHSGSQMRLTVLKRGERRYEFIWSHHHIITDGWCIGIMIREFLELYGSHKEGREPRLGKVTPYSRYIKWLEGVDKEGSLQYWKEYLRGYDTLRALPGSGTGPRGEYEVKESRMEVSGELRASVQRLCGRSGVTENVFLQAVWGILLSRYNDTRDVVFGSAVSGRPGSIEGIEEMIGLFVNTIPVRVRYGEGMTFVELLRQLQEESIAGTDHHHVQLAEIQRQSQLGKELFDHGMQMQNYPLHEILKGKMAGSGGTGGISRSNPRARS